MLLRILLLSVPIALLWMGITGQVTIESFAVGYVIGLLVLPLRPRLGTRAGRPFSLAQPLAFLEYAALIFWNGLVSSLQVVKLVLSPKLELRTGIVALQTGDTSEGQEMAALSAHGINMTPGQLVVDFDDRGTLYIH